MIRATQLQHAIRMMAVPASVEQALADLLLVAERLDDDFDKGAWPAYMRGYMRWVRAVQGEVLSHPKYQRQA